MAQVIGAYVSRPPSGTICADCGCVIDGPAIDRGGRVYSCFTYCGPTWSGRR